MCTTAYSQASTFALNYREAPVLGVRSDGGTVWARRASSTVSNSRRDMSRDRQGDDAELREWTDSISSVIAFEGTGRADDILAEVVNAARRAALIFRLRLIPPIVNTISVEDAPKHPGDREIEHRIVAAIRWNAAAIVLRANKVSSELGGHIASYQSAATLYETGFMHFWHAPTRASWRRSDHDPGALFSRHLCARLSRRTAHRSTRCCISAKRSADEDCPPIRIRG